MESPIPRVAESSRAVRGDIFHEIQEIVEKFNKTPKTIINYFMTEKEKFLKIVVKTQLSTEHSLIILSKITNIEVPVLKGIPECERALIYGVYLLKSPNSMINGSLNIVFAKVAFLELISEQSKDKLLAIKAQLEEEL